MKSVLDTCVISELIRPDGNVEVKAAVQTAGDSNVYLSVVVVGEISKGIGLMAAGRKKKALTAWLSGLESSFSDRILGIDLDTARIWGDLTARAQKRGLIIPAADGLLAATALRHGLQVLTRNTRHFEGTGVVVLDPWRNHNGSA